MKVPFDIGGIKKKFMLHRPHDILGIDLSSDYVKLVHLQESGGKTSVINVASKHFAETEETGIVDYIKAIRREFNMDGNSAVGILSSKTFISRNIDMPSNNRDEISKIINLQVGRFTPYSRDEIVIDYICREITGQHYTNVLLIIVNRKIIERYYRILEEVGLVIERIAISAEGLAMTLVQDGNLKSADGAIGALHVAEQTSDLTILDQDQMVFVRNIALGAQNFQMPGDSAQKEYLEELKKSIAAYQDEGVGKPVKLIAITGITSGLESLPGLIKSNLTTPDGTKLDVKSVNYLKYFDISETALSAINTDRGVSYFDLIASLWTLSKHQLDLIPKEIKLKRHVKEGGREIITLGVWIMSFFLLMSSMMASKIYGKSVQITKLDNINKSTFDEARLLERVSTKNRVVRKLLEKRGKGLSVFDKVTALIGEDIYLTQFSYASDGNLTLAGTADSMSRIFAFVNQLEESNYFTSVKANETKSRREGKNEVADFVIACTLSPGF